MLRRLGLNSLWLLVARILTQGFTVLFIAIVARKLGVRVFGQYAVLASIVYLGNLFTTYGMDVLLIREFGREKQVTSLASTALWVQICLSLLWCTILLFGAFSFLTLELVANLFLYNLSLLPLAFYTVCSATLRAFERMDLFTGLNLSNMLLQVLGALIFVRTSEDLPILCAWLVIAQSITALIGVQLCKANIPDFLLKMSPVFSDILEVIRSGWRIALFSPLSLLSQRLSLFMLAWFSGDILTGWFSASTRLVEGLKLGHFAITNSLIPSMAQTAPAKQQKIYKAAFYGLMLWSLVVAITVTIAGDPIIRIIYGSDFVPSAAVLTVIVWVLIPYTFNLFTSLNLIMQGEEARVLNVNLICLVIATVLYLWLIPRLGMMGAAWVTLMAETLQAMIFLISSYPSPISTKHAN